MCTKGNNNFITGTELSGLLGKFLFMINATLGIFQLLVAYLYAQTQQSHTPGYALNKISIYKLPQICLNALFCHSIMGDLSSLEIDRYIRENDYFQTICLALSVLTVQWMALSFNLWNVKWKQYCAGSHWLSLLSLWFNSVGWWLSDWAMRQWWRAVGLSLASFDFRVRLPSIQVKSREVGEQYKKWGEILHRMKETITQLIGRLF